MLKKKLNKEVIIIMNEKLTKSSTTRLINDLRIFRNYKEDYLTYFNDVKEAQKYDKYIVAIETELTRRGINIK